MIFGDDEIERILAGATAPETSPDDGPLDVTAETTVRVRLADWLGELELRIPHHEATEEKAGERVVYVAIPDPGFLQPSHHEPQQVAMRVCDIEPILDAIQTALDRARRIQLLPTGAA